jgi:hypothetical protein
VIKSAKLARLWVSLERLQPYGNRYGVGDTWRKAYTYRTRDAIYEAFNAIDCYDKGSTRYALANLMFNAWVVTTDIAMHSPNMVSFVEAVMVLSEQTFNKLEGKDK